MGIYIDGLQMPAKGCIKNVIILSNGQVIETTPGCSPQPEKQNYTAISVPPHGRLIDADALNEAMARMVPWAIDDPTANAFLDGLSAAYEAIQADPTRH